MEIRKKCGLAALGYCSLHARRSTYIAVLAVAMFFWTAPAAHAQEAQPLTSGLNQERTLGPGDNHVYTVTLQEGAGLVGEADQHGIDLVIDIFGPDGKLIRTVDSPNGAEGPEPVDLTAFQPGLYKLVIHTLDEKAKPGKYVMKIDRVFTTGENAQRMAQTISEYRQFDE